jgi:hypothetical protein
MLTHVTDAHISDIIACEVYYVFPDTTHTVCVLTLKNGFTVTGESACITPQNFDAGRGREVALGKAKEKIRTLEAYLARQRIYEASQRPQEEAPPQPASQARHPSLINPAVPTRVMVLLDNTRLPEDVPVDDNAYVLKDYVVVCRDVYDQMKDDFRGKN